MSSLLVNTFQVVFEKFKFRSSLQDFALIKCFHVGCSHLLLQEIVPAKRLQDLVKSKSNADFYHSYEAVLITCSILAVQTDKV